MSQAAQGDEKRTNFYQTRLCRTDIGVNSTLAQLSVPGAYALLSCYLCLICHSYYPNYAFLSDDEIYGLQQDNPLPVLSSAKWREYNEAYNKDPTSNPDVRALPMRDDSFKGVI